VSTAHRLNRLTHADAAPDLLVAAIEQAVGLQDLRLELWDGRSSGVAAASATSVVRVNSRKGLDRLLGSVPSRGFGRAYAEGEIEVEPLEPLLSAFATATARDVVRATPKLLRASLQLGARPDWSHIERVEARLKGRRHSTARDAQAIRHHYDLPADFYALWLDKSLTYSCAYFNTPGDDIDTAQFAKLDLVCRKLRLQGGERVLDVGCGWGSFTLHAARNYGVHVTGITLSSEQAKFAQDRVREEGLEDRITIKVADYRDDLGETFDAVASIGMVEHVGRHRMSDFAKALYRATRPGGRLLLHGITIPAGGHWSRGSFTDAFVFPDGELEDVSWRDGRIGAAGFELRDVESLREHYALTLRNWVERLNARWQEAVEIVGLERARVWRLYLTGSMVAFQRATISVHQSLFVRPGADGGSGLPLRRADWYAPGG
jgi:cyclopropane-fatty-acyl-phospholipid synthase